MAILSPFSQHIDMPQSLTFYFILNTFNGMGNGGLSERNDDKENKMDRANLARRILLSGLDSAVLHGVLHTG